MAESGDPQRFLLPKGRVSRPEGGFHPHDFSFSGLKTAMRERPGNFVPIDPSCRSLIWRRFEQVVLRCWSSVRFDVPVIRVLISW